MTLLRRAISGCVLWAVCTAAVRADDSLPPETVQRLKDATVFVKTEIGPVKMTGSGFVIEVTGDTALIATNQHVIAKPKELRQGGYIPGLRGRDRLALMRIQQALATAQPEVSVVFNSGNPNEQLIKAQLMGELEEPDLAILKVSGIKAPPTAISFQNAAPPVETMPLYILGFPFGDALATNKGNPTITIGKGSVSSIRNDANGKLAKVQIDGALNPGNSGGPVVDVKGNLVGISVQTIQGSNIGLAIPPGELISALEGQVGTPTVVVGKVEKGATPTYEAVVPLLDPMKKLKSVAIQYVDGAAPIDASKNREPQLQAVPGSVKVTLSKGDREARGALLLPSSAQPAAREVTVQAEYVKADGQVAYSAPLVVKVAAPQTTDTTVVQEGNSTTVTQVTKTPGGGTSRRQVTITRGAAPSNKMAQMKDDEDDEEKPAKKSSSKKEVASTSKSTTSKAAAKPADEEGDDKPAKKAAEIGWTNKMSKLKVIPDEEVTGKIDGVQFKLDRATLNNLGLQLEMGPNFRGSFSEATMDIRLMTKPNEDVSGRKYVVNGQHRFGDPSIFASSMREGDRLPRTQPFLEYMMVLEFGEYNAEDRIQPGKIYICLPDRGKSFLAGTFEASAK